MISISNLAEDLTLSREMVMSKRRIINGASLDMDVTGEEENCRIRCVVQ
jgi:hypothetical protein